MTAYRVAYDGTDYHGFQRQPDVVTVEGTILTGLVELDLIDEAMSPPDGYAAAGRTDAGVSALAQTIAFRAPEWVTPTVLNGVLPEDIRVWSTADAPADFHATYDAVSRTYEYHLSLDGTDIDLETMGWVMDRFAGSHDFHNLTPDDTGTERDLKTALRMEDSFAILSFTADGFPRQFVRRAVTLVREVASGERTRANLEAVLEGPPVDGPDGVETASAHPLLLTSVTYPSLTFEVDEEAADAARMVFSGHRTRLETRARIADRIVDGMTTDRQRE